jgi:hypothetical protein
MGRSFLTLAVAAVLLALAASRAMAVPITYEGVLTNGVTRLDQLVPRTSTGFPGDAPADFVEAAYWSFSGTAGAAITLTVNRLEASLDPTFFLYTGIFADTDDVAAASSIAFADDEIAEFPGFAGPFADPQLLDFVLPVTGNYTVLLMDGVSGSPGADGLYAYQITLGPPPTGPVQVPDPTIPEPGTLALLGAGLAGLVIVRRRRT